MGSVMERLDARERAAAARAEQIRQQIVTLTEQLGEDESELEWLRIGRAVLAGLLTGDEPSTAEPVGPPEAGPVAGLGVRANVAEAMRGKLNRLVERGWCVFGEPGRYALAGGVAGRIAARIPHGDGDKAATVVAEHTLAVLTGRGPPPGSRTPAQPPIPLPARSMTVEVTPHLLHPHQLACCRPRN